MRLIKPHFEIWEQESGIQGIYKAIERAGRICYLSGDKITEDSAQPFVDRMIKSGHGAMLEHGTVYLKLSPSEIHTYSKYKDNPYTKVHITYSGEPYPVPTYYVSTNYRVLIEHGWLDDLKWLCEPTEFHEKRVCVHFTADIGILREFFRHRTMSMAQESTRYCNYSKDKFGNEITFIKPLWVNNIEDAIYDDMPEKVFINSLKVAENYYFNLLDKGWQPQQARAVLPLCTKSEAVMTGFESDWEYFFELRTPANAHPQARELAIPLSEEFVKRGLINENN